MTKEEFGTFCNEFCAVFPSFGNWFQKLPDRGKHTAEAWYTAFRKVGLDVARKLLPLMRDDSDQYPPLDKYDYEDFPRHIPKMCRRWKYDQEENAKNKSGHKPWMKGVFDIVRQTDPVMSRELKRLTNAMEARIGHPLPIRQSDEITPKQLCDAALRDIGGFDFDTHNEG